MILEQLTSAQILLGSNLLLPLEWCVRLWHKIRRRHMDPESPLFVGAKLLPLLDDPVNQLRDSQNILIGFRRQSQHKI